MAERLKIEREAGRLLAEKGFKLAVAESCTGGLIGHRITSVAGSSEWFSGGVIAYANEVKIAQLGVRRDALDKFGAVSGIVARQMAEGVKSRFKSDVAVAVTGIAGPGGGSAKKAVGLVFIAVAGGGGRTVVRRFRFKGDRAAVKKAGSESAIKMLIGFLKKKRSG